MRMYQRVESIEEECLDWGSHLVLPLEKIELKTAETVVSLVPEESKIFLNERVISREKFNVKRKVTYLAEENPELFFIFSILTFPYIVGFLACYFLFYFYGGMTISSFFLIQQGHLQIELFAIGAYLFVTLGVIWAISEPLMGFVRRER